MQDVLKLWMFCSLLSLFSCASEVPPPEEPVVPAYYTLRNEATVEKPWPFLSESPVTVVWKYSDGSTTEEVEFIGRSLPGSTSTFVMLEKKDGSSCLFDFDEDGTVDFEGECRGTEVFLPEDL